MYETIVGLLNPLEFCLFCLFMHEYNSVDEHTFLHSIIREPKVIDNTIKVLFFLEIDQRSVENRNQTKRFV